LSGRLCYNDAHAGTVTFEIRHHAKELMLASHNHQLLHEMCTHTQRLDGL